MTVNISGTTGIDTVNNTALVSKTIESPTLTGTVVYPSGQTIASPIFTGSPVITSAGGGLITLTPVSTASNFTLTVPAKTSTIDTLARTGNVLQVVSGFNSGKFSTTSASDTVLVTSVSITPTSATSKIVVIATSSLSIDLAENAVFYLKRNGTTTLTQHYTRHTSYTVDNSTFTVVDSPATTSATYYTLNSVKPNGGTTPINIGGRSIDSAHGDAGVDWILIEIAG